MIKKAFLVMIFISLFFSVSFAQNNVIISGKTVYSKSKKPIEYVDIGLFEENIGTISNDKGYFQINIPQKFINDSLIFSSIGYQTNKFRISDLAKRKTNLITLTPKTIQLSEVQIKSKTTNIKAIKTDENYHQVLKRFEEVFHAPAIQKDRRFCRRSQDEFFGFY